MARLTFNAVKVELEKYEITVEKTTKGYDCICQGFGVPQKTLKDCLQYRDNLLDGSTCDLPLPTVNEIKVNEIKTCHFPSISDAIKYVTSFGAVLTGSISSNERSQYEYSINGTVVLICKEHGEPDYWVHVKDKDKEEANKITFDEVKTFALSCGYILTKLNNEYCKFSLCSNGGRIGQFTKLEGVTEVIKEGRLLIGEACAIANLNNLEEENKINLRIDGKMVAINLDVHHEIKLSHDPVFGWQLVGVDSQVLREPLNVEDKTQPTLKFKTRESASRFAAKLAAKVKNIKEDRVREYKQRAIKEFMVKVNNA